MQHVTKKRWKASINLTPIYSGKLIDSIGPTPSETQSFWLSSLKDGLHNYEDTTTESNTPPSEATRVDESCGEVSFVDFHLADSFMKTERVRRRSVDGISVEKGTSRSRSKTVPCQDEKEAMLLFTRFELDQLKAKRQTLNHGQEVTGPVSEDTAARLEEAEAPFQVPDLISFLEEAERYSKFAIGAYGTNMMKILGCALFM